MNPAVYFLSTVQKNHIPIPITIGTQIWDSINLNTAYYTDGTPIQFGMLSGQTVGGWYWYNNDPSKGLIYGRLYNRYAVEGVDGSGITKTMAPPGWRISTPEDWTTLSDYLGGVTVAGGKLKQAGFSLWQANNTGATNSSGFTALPGGRFRRSTDTYEQVNLQTNFRTTNYLTSPTLSYNSAALTYSSLTDDNNGFSVRLIKMVPTMTTTAGTVGSPSSSAINSGGNISDANGYTITQKGVCWGTSANPIKGSGNFTSNGSGIGTFTSNITGLSPNITYYIRVYAVTPLETFYANDVIFTTTGTSSITTSTVTPKPVTAISGGTITSSNTNTIGQSGICWAVYPATPTIALSTKTTDGQTGIAPPDKNCGAGSMTGLTQGTQYNVRAYVTTTDTTYGNQVSFETPTDDTNAITNSVTTITPISATVNYTINAGTYYPIITQGVCWSTTPNPTTALTTKTTITGGLGGDFSASLTGLGPSSTYYIRAYITNTSGTIYSTVNITSFLTASANIPLHVFSMRQYITTDKGYAVPYTGYAMTVRRGTGAAIVTVNVSFNSSGWVGLDSAISPVLGSTTSTTLGGFAGIAGSIGPIYSPANQTIYVSKWYDQSGNAKDVVQTLNTTSQPTIIISGGLNTINSRPCIKFASASGTYLSFTDSNTIPLNNLTSFSVISNSVLANQQPYALNNGDTSAYRYSPLFILTANTDNIAYGSAFGNSYGTNAPLNTVRLYNLVTTSTRFSAWRNTTPITPTPVVRTNTGNIAYISIGRSGGTTSNYLTGSIQEILCFSGATSREAISSEIISTYTIT
jgi:uncharacterized protein (TIGR02145 family)